MSIGGWLYVTESQARTRNVPEDQEMSSGSEFNSTAGANDLTGLGDLADLQKKKRKGWPKGKARK